MRIPLEWLREYVKTSASDEVLIDVLEQAGIEVESQGGRAPELSAAIVVAEILAVKPHPNADKLSLATVTAGEGELEIVCGAPNIKKGQKVPLATVGTVMPDGLKIKKSKIRGEVSSGMLCSSRELQISEDHEGILVLDGDAKIGEPVRDILGAPQEQVIEIKTPPANRPDALSIIGLGMDAYTGLGVRALRDRSIERSWSQPVLAKVRQPKKESDEVFVQDATLVSRYILKRYKLKNGESPEWMQARLKACGMRPINAIVDISNYVMLELGQPTHAFDGKKIGKTVVVRAAQKGEKLKALDGKTYDLTPEMLVIADKEKPVGIAGVIGGTETEVDAKTTEIALEVAVFDGTGIRRTARELGLRTEASARYERGLPLQLAEQALARVEHLLTEVCDAKPVDTGVDLLAAWPWVQHIGLRRSRIERILGYQIEPAVALQILRDLGCKAEDFDIVEEARKHLGKPYVWGASYKKNGSDAFDCSYLTDYIYSLIGRYIGHTCLAQYEIGAPVDEGDLRPGDNLFYEGYNKEGRRDFSLDEIQSNGQPLSSVGSYYKKDELTGEFRKVQAKHKGLIGHNGIYIGGGRVIHAVRYIRDEKGEVVEQKNPSVMEVPVEAFLRHPQYLGARRYIDDLDDYIAVTTPFWRPDLRTEEDLIEEIARFWGYAEIPATLPAWRGESAVVPQDILFKRKVRQVLAGAGLTEIISYSFVSEKLATAWEGGGQLKLQNPLNSEQGYLRSALEPSMLSVLAANSRSADRLSLFEISRVFAPGAGELPDERIMLTAGLLGDEPLSRAKALLPVIYLRLGLNTLEIKQEEVPGLAAGRSATLWVRPKDAQPVRVGYYGEVSSGTAAQFNLKNVAMISFELTGLQEAAAQGHTYVEPNRFPEVKLDISVKVADDEANSARSIFEAVIAHDLVTAHTWLEVGRGSFAGKGKKNVILHMHYGSRERTLTEAEAAKAQDEIVALLQKKFGAELS
jgi:phenylalanyl-tRNA synthetase beta subunit